MEETYVYVLSWVCVVISIACQLVGIEICSKIIKKGAGDISPIPFFAFFISACWWLRYGFMQKISTVIMTNVFGAVLQFIYITIYYIYSMRKSHVRRLVSISLVLLFSPLIYTRFYQLDNKVATQQMGTLCIFVTIVCYASPLATLATVVRTKSCDFISCFVSSYCCENKKL
ncbi:sugar transporter SWEET1-like isoform X2 [Gigantopelta aegis]|uniref:sugar transporter SWEET1-like isoform X2 n=1 Tax=Gigantopelta aegis TaxID=1735272 RepID=UPI001B887744|nr:sugar transporter SWEET1-like isoform X2 [Gigantopelta aegis]